MLVSCLAAALVTVGCEDGSDEGIRSYRVVKEAPRTSGAGLTPAQSSPERVAWDLPEGWEEQLSPGSMRYATLWAGEGDERLETAVTPLSGDAGGPEANVQRWRGQLGLAEAAEEELRGQMTEIVSKSGVRGWLVELVGPAPEVSLGDNRKDAGATADAAAKPEPPQGMLAAIFRSPSQSWFFKATGPQPVIERHREAFIALCQSVRFDGGSGV